MVTKQNGGKQSTVLYLCVREQLRQVSHMHCHYILIMYANQ